MRKELAEKLDKDFEKEYGDQFVNIEDMVDMCVKNGLITPTSAGNYLLCKDFQEIKQQQEGLPKEDRMSDTKIRNEMSIDLNCSPHKIYLATKDI